MTKDIASLSIEELESLMKELGEKPYRAKQIFSWIHKKNVFDFKDMTDISENLRLLLSEKFSFSKTDIVKTLVSKNDETRKYLFELTNGTIIESVLMKYSYGNSVCISSQAGCRMGCRFCASATGGLERNLTPSEMLNQIYFIQKDLKEKITHIVIMGTGEPLDNYDNTLKFISLANNKAGLDISQRRISLSTCGLTDKIYSLADQQLQITLAISLHAPNDDIRKKIMPIANSISLNEILKACKYYTDKTKRRVTFEYALIDGVNDSLENALELSKKIRGLMCHVNLIPINHFEESEYKKSHKQKVLDFSAALQKNEIEVTVRRELGNDIEAACGQLRKRFTDNTRGV